MVFASITNIFMILARLRVVLFENIVKRCFFFVFLLEYEQHTVRCDRMSGVGVKWRNASTVTRLQQRR